MSVGLDFSVGTVAPPDVLRAVFARAYEIPFARVAIMPSDLFVRADDAWPDADVVIDFGGGGPFPGDYPLDIATWGEDDRTDDQTVASAIAVELGAPVLIAADSYDPADRELYLPDGTMHRVSVDQDDDGGIRNTPEMQRLIAAARAALTHAA